MQITLKMALATAAFAMASVQALAVDMPSDGTKNFSSPSDAPSYFANEAIPESERVNHQATFDSEEVQEPPGAEERPVSSEVSGTSRHGRHFAGYRLARHPYGRYSARAGAAHFATATHASRSITTRSGGQVGAIGRTRQSTPGLACDSTRRQPSQ